MVSSAARAHMYITTHAPNKAECAAHVAVTEGGVAGYRGDEAYHMVDVREQRLEVICTQHSQPVTSAQAREGVRAPIEPLSATRMPLYASRQPSRNSLICSITS
jgi:hypothetical protein